MIEGQDVVQICLNGHVINASSRRYPQYNKKFCDKCGETTITNCQNCDADIKGRYHRRGFFNGTRFPALLYCDNCGEPYPWTKVKIQAAHDLAQELENISNNEKIIMSQSIDKMVKDTPETTLAATRFQKILSKASEPIASAFRDILVDIVSETAKKILWP